MKNSKLLAVVGLILIVATFFAMNALPALLGIGGAIQAMAFITAGSEYNGAENMDIILRPRILGTRPQQMGIRTIDTKGASSYKLMFFGVIKKVLMPYLAGFQGGAVTEKLQKKITLAEFKAEAAYDKHDYAGLILEQIVDRGGIKQNDITGTDVFNAEVKVFMDAVEDNVFGNFWLGDTAKTHTHAGTYPSGAAYAAGDADKYYNNADGILKKIITDGYQNYVSKQSTIAGWNTTTYPTLYLQEESGTIYAYDTAAHRTSKTSGSRLFHFTTGATFPATRTITADNTSGFSGSVQCEKAIGTDATFELYARDDKYIRNLTLPTLTTDTAATYFKRLYRLATPELRKLKESGLLRFYVSDTIMQNYEDTLLSGTLESSKQMLVDGVQRFAWNGIPIIPIGIDALIESDFASTFSKDWMILSTPDNLCLTINGTSDFSQTRFWFNPDENENRQRTQFEMAYDYVLPELIAYARSSNS